MAQRLIVAITGSSAPHLGVALLKALQGVDEVESHLVVSHGARRSIELELGAPAEDVEKLADVVYDPDDLAAAVSSGSFVTMGMVVAPCSMRTLAAIATGNAQDLVVRAADVCLKERRTLVLMPRETPLNLIHIRNMETVTLAGAVVLPPVPAFYHRPRTIDDLLDHWAGKMLDQSAEVAPSERCGARRSLRCALHPATTRNGVDVVCREIVVRPAVALLRRLLTVRQMLLPSAKISPLCRTGRPPAPLGVVLPGGGAQLWQANG